LPLHARVIRVEITARQDVLHGKAFGAAGSYERLTGRIYFSLAISNSHNQRIVDLANAVNLKDGEVEFSSDFMALRPKDPHKSNGSMILENPNRGHGRIVSLVDGGDWDASNDAGDAWLLRNGFTIVTLGWQWDAYGADALRLAGTGRLAADRTPRRFIAQTPTPPSAGTLPARGRRRATRPARA